MANGICVLIHSKLYKMSKLTKNDKDSGEKLAFKNVHKKASNAIVVIFVNLNTKPLPSKGSRLKSEGLRWSEISTRNHY
jgi:hypothetical protein